MHNIFSENLSAGCGRCGTINIGQADHTWSSADFPSNRRACEWTGFHLINMISLNEPHVLIKGFLHNHLKSFGEWEKSIVLVHYFGSSVRVSTASDGNIGLWMGPFDRLLFVSEDRRLHVYSITHEFNKHVSMFKETDKLLFVSGARRPRRICLALKTRRKQNHAFYHV